MVILIADSCALIAAYDADHPDTDACGQVLDRVGYLVVSPLVLAEVDHMATRILGREGARTIIADIRRYQRVLRVVVPEITADILDLAEGLRDRYAGLNLDLADAVNAALAFQHHTDAVFTVDRRDFRAMRPLGPHKAFRILPDDA
ncbi:type II toxin-antitoxin system VapC family toxin [Streptomyces lasiicapitis]|uniref:type II toxin-antitoxin system VapC family toxin n=1 Tax=Streptomyces lasiicapitis TaxID=1923961 RepID=UPI00366A0A77